ncbi:hypothetical protein [Aminobacterium colombiense]|jgi:hypothetical protein|uniref:hypothetical protein n=1 Tax=Aminobacterium colombiense TaxID=81468 RepID=UPI00259A8392|nr:hypothetical protein [uncultured Aminobacterium sp.]
MKAEINTRDIIPNIITRDLKEGQELCPICQGLGLIQEGDYIVPCPDCLNGIARKCQYCGEIISLHKYHHCEPMIQQQQKEQIEKVKKEWAAAEKISLKQAIKNYKMLYDYSNDEFIFSSEIEAYLKSKENPLIFATSTYSIAMDANTIIENECDDLYEDAFENISQSKVDELQEFLNKWCEEVKEDTLTYCPDYKKAVEF